MKFFILLISMFISLSVSASTDPFVDDYFFHSGPYRGQRVDTDTRRSLKIIDRGSEMIEIANVAHAGKFYRARVDLKKIKHVIFQIVHFEAIVPAAHTQLRFELLEGQELELVNQYDESDKVRTRSLIYSLEANIQPGDEYDLIKGLKKRYKIAHRARSFEDVVETQVLNDRSEIDQYLLNFNADISAKILVELFEQAEREGMRKFYHTLTKNCTTELFKAINRVVGKRRSIRQIPTNIGRIYPPWATMPLRTEKWIEKKLMDLEQEIAADSAIR